MASLFLTALRKEARIAKKKVSIPIVRKKSELEKSELWDINLQLEEKQENCLFISYNSDYNAKLQGHISQFWIYNSQLRGTNSFIYINVFPHWNL